MPNLPKIEFRKIDLPKVDIRAIEIPNAVETPIYAGVGAADLAYSKAKAYADDVQSKTQARISEVQSKVKGIEVPQRKTVQDRAAKRVAALQADAKALPGKVQSQVKNTVDESVATVTSTYSDLAKRGERVVLKLRTGDGRQVVKPSTEAPIKPAAKKAPARKTAAKKAPAKKAPAKSTTARTTTAKKTTTTTTTTTKKAPAKKA